MRAFLTSIFLSALFYVSAATYNVSGVVVDQQSEPEAFATVRVFAADDSVKAASLGVTDDNGFFKQTVKKTGDYKLVVSSVGKKSIVKNFSLTDAKPSVDLGTLTISDNAAELGEVEVVATKPLVVKEIDRIGYDVQADMDSKTATVQDILRKVPMVTVEADGTIKVKGSTNFKIYKDGRPSNSFTNNAKDIFAAIPASMIKKIEVITDPGAKEDAEGVGAILNIVTLDNTSLNGVMGNVGAGFMTNNDVPAAHAWLTGNIDKVVISAYGGYFHQGNKMGRSTSENEMIFADSGNRQFTNSASSSHGDIGFFGIDGSYELDSLNLFTMEFGGFTYGMKSRSTSTTEMFNPDATSLYRFSQNSRTPKMSFLDFNGNFNYQRSTRLKDETITFSYAISNNNNSSKSESEYFDLHNFPAPYSGINTDSDLKFLEQTLQLDWTRPINQYNKFSVGGKLILRNNHAKTTTEYVDDRDDFNDFIHRTTIGAGYFDYRFSKNKLSARAGLRYEYSHLAAKFKDGSQPDFGSDLNDFVPNASVMYTINDANTIKAAYSSRISRPGINFLNPTVNENPTSQSSGNPDLESPHYNSLSLNYSLIKQKFSMDLTASYDFANNTIAQLTYTEPRDGVDDYMISTYGNVGRDRTFDFSAFVQWQMTSKTSVMLNGSVSYNRISIPRMGLKNSRWSTDIFFRATQQLPWKLRIEGMMFYGTGDLQSVYAYGKNNSRAIFHGFALQRSFLKEDRLTVKLHARNPFNNKTEWKTITNRGDYSGYSRSIMSNQRIFGIEISYRFGSVRASVKKTAKSISNDDLQGGASAPSTSGASGTSTSTMGTSM